MEMTMKELANLAGYTYRRLYDINRDLPPDRKIFVAGEGGKYDLAIFVQRWVDYNVERVSAAADDLDAVKAQHESVKMRKTQLEVDRMEGSLVDVQEVRRIWGDIANTIMQSMIHLPSTLAPMVRGMENVEVIGNVIDTEIRKVLEGLAGTPLPAYLLLQEDDDEAEEE